MTSIDPPRGETARVLAFSGSARQESWNTRLLGIAAADLRAQGVAVTELSLRDHPLPLYDGDLEEAAGVPRQAFALRRLIQEHDGLLIACPEYNGSVTPLLKNALDWCSRSGDGLGRLEPFRLKPALIVGTSIGPFGALRAIGHLRAILGKMGAAVVPEDLALPHADAAFRDGILADRGATGMLRGLVELLAAEARHFSRTRR